MRGRETRKKIIQHNKKRQLHGIHQAGECTTKTEKNQTAKNTKIYTFFLIDKNIYLWCTHVLLALLFPSCYSLAQNKWGSVKDHMIRSIVLCSWNLSPRRNLNDWEVEEMGRLLNLLENYSLGDRESEDELIWSIDTFSGFSVRSCFNAAPPASDTVFPHQLVWDKLTPSKVSFFLWELWWDCAPRLTTLSRGVSLFLTVAPCASLMGNPLPICSSIVL